MLPVAVEAGGQAVDGILILCGQLLLEFATLDLHPGGSAIIYARSIPAGAGRKQQGRSHGGKQQGMTIHRFINQLLEFGDNLVVTLL